MIDTNRYDVSLLHRYMLYVLYSFFNPVHGRDDAENLEVRDAI